MTAAIGVISGSRLYPYWGARWNFSIARSLAAVSSLNSGSLQRGATAITIPFDVVPKAHGGFVSSEIEACVVSVRLRDCFFPPEDTSENMPFISLYLQCGHCNGGIPGNGDVGESLALMVRLTWNCDFRIVSKELIITQSLVIPIHMGIVNCYTVMHMS